MTIIEAGETTLTKARRRTKTEAKLAISPVMIGVVAVAAILIVGGLILLGNRTRAGQPVDTNQFPALGDPNAPVKITEFSDYG